LYAISYVYTQSNIQLKILNLQFDTAVCWTRMAYKPVKRVPMPATKQGDEEAMMSTPIDDVLRGLQDVSSVHFVTVQLGILSVALTAAAWFGVYSMADDYNDVNPYLPSLPILVYLVYYMLFYAVYFFIGEYHIYTRAGKGLVGFEKLFSMDKIDIIVKFLLNLWVTFFVVIMISYLTYYYHFAHVLSPSLLWGLIALMSFVLLLCNIIRRVRHNMALADNSGNN